MDHATLSLVNLALNLLMFAALTWAVLAGRARARRHSEDLARGLRDAMTELLHDQDDDHGAGGHPT